jgi:quinol monooxygenase YgiN
MPTIAKGRKPLTLINVFTVAPENQQELIDLLTEVTARDVRHHKGFVSASLHRGIDGKKVTMYAQWASVEDYEAMRQNSRSAPALEQALQIAEFDPGMYEVAEIFVPDGPGPALVSGGDH